MNFQSKFPTKCPKCNSTKLKYINSGRLLVCECGFCIEEKLFMPYPIESLNIKQGKSLDIMSPDLESFQFKSEEVPNDPYGGGGFISSFSTIDIQSQTLFGVLSSKQPAILDEFSRNMEKINPFQNGEEINSKAFGKSKIFPIAYFIIHETCIKLSLDMSIVSRTLEITNQYIKKVQPRVNLIRRIAVSAILIAAREKTIPLTLKEISETTGISTKKMGKTTNLISKELGLNSSICSVSAHSLIAKFFESIPLGSEVETLAGFISKQILDGSFTNLRNPRTITAISIYFAASLEGVRITQKALSQQAEVTETTIRRTLRDLIKSIHKMVPENYVPKKNLKEAFSHAFKSNQHTINVSILGYLFVNLTSNSSKDFFEEILIANQLNFS
ncbi:plant-specific tfiib-related protein [Anaeramoeba ignava]|uniref:Plant-specific tfiib-related protein n=1 Tax=Anaeramoeba ignava TaxID=1746090 RepID=A0A9Q0LDE3_ANAIG|nr:plant-specific tfiib-related protein [Anaeramoeba ignava]